jgi:hypothetical protein
MAVNLHIDAACLDIDAVNLGIDAVDLGIDAVNLDIGAVNLSIDAVDLGIDAVNLDIGAVNLSIDAVDLGIDAVNLDIGAVNLGIDAVNLDIGAVRLDIDAVDLGTDTVDLGTDAVNLGTDAVSLGIDAQKLACISHNLIEPPCLFRKPGSDVAQTLLSVLRPKPRSVSACSLSSRARPAQTRVSVPCSSAPLHTIGRQAVGNSNRRVYDLRGEIDAVALHPGDLVEVLHERCDPAAGLLPVVVLVRGVVAVLGE